MSVSVFNHIVLLAGLVLAYMYFAHPSRRKVQMEGGREAEVDMNNNNEAKPMILGFLIIPAFLFYIISYLLPVPEGFHFIIAVILAVSMLLSLVILAFDLPGKLKNEGVNTISTINIFLPVIICIMALFSGIIGAIMNRPPPPEPVVQTPPPVEKKDEKTISFIEVKEKQNKIQEKMEQSFKALNQETSSKNPVQPIFKFKKKTQDDKTVDLVAEYAYEFTEKGNLSSLDYPGGRYVPTTSKAAQTLGETIQKSLQTNLKKYLHPSANVYINISGYTDAIPAKRASYKGEYGQFPQVYKENGTVNFYLNDKLTPIYLKDKAKLNNAKLAFLRAYGLKTLLEETEALSDMNVDTRIYAYPATEGSEEKDQYRGVKVEVVLEDVER